MTNRVIPEAAVEAAARADYGNGDQYGTWATEPDEVREMYLKDARLILEVAAPHLLADHLLTLAVDVKARGDIGKDEGLESWDYLTWKAEQIRPTK